MLKFIKALAEKLTKTQDRNTAQRLIRTWCAKQPDYKPTCPRLLFVPIATRTPHETREGVPVLRWTKQTPDNPARRVPVMLHYAMPVDRRRAYPYASTRQNSRALRRAARLPLAA